MCASLSPHVCACPSPSAAMFRYFIDVDDPAATVSRSDVVACLLVCVCVCVSSLFFSLSSDLSCHQLACTTDDERRTLQQLIVEALQSRLGLKSIWAKDVTLASFQVSIDAVHASSTPQLNNALYPFSQNVVSYTPILVDCFSTHLQSSLKR